MSNTPRTSLFLALALLVAPLPFAAATHGGYAQVVIDNATFGADGSAQTLFVRVYDEFGAAVTTADVTLACYDPGCDVALGLQPDVTAISGNGQPGRGAWGEYVFGLAPITPGTYGVEVIFGDEGDGSVGSANFWVYPAALYFAGLFAPPEASVGEQIPITATLFNDGPTDRWVEPTLLVNGANQGSYLEYLPAYSIFDFTFWFTPTVAGTYSLEVVLPTGETTGMALLSVIPPAKLVAADVTTSQLFPTSAPLTLQDANMFTRGVFQVRYDPAIVEVRSITETDAPGMGALIAHDAENGVIQIAIVSVGAFNGNLTVATIEYAAVELHNTDSTISLDVLEYQRASGYSYAAGGSAHFHGSVLGATGDDVLRAL